MFNYRKATNTAPTASAPNYSAPSASVKVVMPGTLGFYNKLCAEKGVEPVMNESSLHSIVQAECERIKALPNYSPASEAQMRRINERCEAMNMVVPSKTFSKSEANEFIQKLDQRFVDLGLDKIVTAKQIEMLRKMAMCPDIPVFALHLPNEMLDKADALQHEYNLAIHNLNIGTGSETIVSDLETEMSLFQAECEAYTEGKDLTKLNKEDVSMFIQNNQATYYAWVNSRASEGQRSLMKTLYARTGQVMSDEYLLQFDSKQANEVIDQLQKEMGRTYGGTLEPTAREVKKGVTSDLDISNEQAELINNSLHTLYAIIGQEAEQDILHSGMNPFIIFLDLIDLVSFYTTKDVVEEAIDGIFTSEEVEMLLAPFEK